MYHSSPQQTGAAFKGASDSKRHQTHEKKSLCVFVCVYTCARLRESTCVEWRLGVFVRQFGCLTTANCQSPALLKESVPIHSLILVQALLCRLERHTFPPRLPCYHAVFALRRWRTTWTHVQLRWPSFCNYKNNFYKDNTCSLTYGNPPTPSAGQNVSTALPTNPLAPPTRKMSGSWSA